MIMIRFLAEWAIRSSILILGGALLLRALRLNDASIRLAGWTALLFGSLAIPVLTASLPKLPLLPMRAAPQAVETALVPPQDGPVSRPATAATLHPAAARSLAWPVLVIAGYLLVAGALLLRVGVGILLGRRMRRNSRATGRMTEGIEIRESDGVAAPVTLGIARPAIVLPADWRAWDDASLNAVLAHERSHVRRHDPAIHLLSAVHRALLWHSPLTWFLHRRIVRVAEEASDDAALAVTHDRALYAQVLLDFMQRGSVGVRVPGVPMARYGRPDERIHRILNGSSISHGLTRWSVAAILAFASPLAYVVAVAQPSAPVPLNSLPATRAQVVSAAANLRPVAQQPVPKPATAPHVRAQPSYLTGLGSVAAFYTVVVKPRVSGELLSVDFKEGALVRQGQALATIDARSYEIQLAQAQAQLSVDETQLAGYQSGISPPGKDATRAELVAQSGVVTELNARITADRARVDNAKLQVAYTRIVAPITGVAGLRMVDPGNVVQADTPLVIVAQLQPIAVLFTIPEDNVRQVRASLNGDTGPVVEAWDRTNSVRIATGHLTAIDNQIDATTGTSKLKAVFDNKDGALFPSQFVNVHLQLPAR